MTLWLAPAPLLLASQSRVRRALLEAAVVVGPRAWLPFLCAHHLLEVPNKALGKSLDFTLSQLFHQAVRHASV